MRHLAVVIIVPPVLPTQKAGVQKRARRVSNPQPPEPQSGSTPSTQVEACLFWLSDASLIVHICHGYPRVSIRLATYWLHIFIRCRYCLLLGLRSAQRLACPRSHQQHDSSSSERLMRHILAPAELFLFCL